MTIKTKILSGLAALIMSFSACGGGDDSVDGCTKDSDCKSGRICDYQTGECVEPEEPDKDIYTETSQPELECEIKPGFGGCENFTGVYEFENGPQEINEMTYEFVAFYQSSKHYGDVPECDIGCCVNVIGIEPNDKGKECLDDWQPPNVKGNYISQGGLEFIKCDVEKIKMLFNGNETVLTKYSNEILTLECFKN